MLPLPAAAAKYIGPAMTPAATVLWGVLGAPLVEFVSVLWSVSSQCPPAGPVGFQDFAPDFDPAFALMALAALAGAAVLLFLGLVIVADVRRKQ